MSSFYALTSPEVTELEKKNQEIVRRLAGENSHHIIEGAFKALARALAEAVSIDAEHANEIPSTKGTIL